MCCDVFANSLLHHLCYCPSSKSVFFIHIILPNKFILVNVYFTGYDDFVIGSPFCISFGADTQYFGTLFASSTIRFLHSLHTDRPIQGDLQRQGIG